MRAVEVRGPRSAGLVGDSDMELPEFSDPAEALFFAMAVRTNDARALAPSLEPPAAVLKE